MSPCEHVRRSAPGFSHLLFILISCRGLGQPDFVAHLGLSLLKMQLCIFSRTASGPGWLGDLSCYNLNSQLSTLFRHVLCLID